jgi:sugar/nucleoside kinase (ribokinase family)
VSLLVVGTLAYDTIETPSGRADDVLGGAATYCAIAASFFVPVRLVGVVGEDFRPEDRELLAGHHVLLDGLEQLPGKSFRWSGSYVGDLNVAETLDTQLNVLEGWKPVVPEAFRSSRFVFLANSPPELQARVLDQVDDGAFKVMDTMNLWIEQTWEDLHALLPRVDMLICNDKEALALGEDHSLIRAARKLLRKGPSIVIVKKGEHGAFLWSREFFYALPAYPLEHVVDPTGAGDTFAGGVMGSLASAGRVSEPDLRRAVIHGSVLASFNVEDFSLNRLRQITRSDIDARYREFLHFTAHP